MLEATRAARVSSVVGYETGSDHRTSPATGFYRSGNYGRFPAFVSGASSARHRDLESGTEDRMFLCGSWRAVPVFSGMALRRAAPEIQRLESGGLAAPPA